MPYILVNRVVNSYTEAMDEAAIENSSREAQSAEISIESDDDRKPAAKRDSPEDDETGAKKVKREPDTSTVEVNETSVVEVLPVAPRDCPAVASLPVPGDEDEDVQFVGATGNNPLTDFPHAREHCRVHLFRVDPALHCINCFCFVCDNPVSDCKEWNDHCHATQALPKWRQERQQRANQAAAAPQTSTRPSHQNLYRARTVKQLLEAVTLIYPSEITPPSPPFLTKLKHYQKQSLAFMMDVEHNYQVKSGWVCSDVGMGKSATVISVIANNPMMPLRDQPSAQEVKDARVGKQKVNVKCTVIFTTKSLLGQWEDEFKKHAPSLKVYRLHNKSKMKLADLSIADVIVTTSTAAWTTSFTRHFRYHRVLVDESHLLGTVSARMENVCELESDRCWCVTATPMVSSVRDLRNRIAFLDLENE